MDEKNQLRWFIDKNGIDESRIFTVEDTSGFPFEL